MAPNADDREEVRERLIERLDPFTPPPPGNSSEGATRPRPFRQPLEKPQDAKRIAWIHLQKLGKSLPDPNLCAHPARTASTVAAVADRRASR